MARARTQTRRATRARAIRTPKQQQARVALAKARFLRAFANCGNVLQSAKAAGIGRRTVYDWLKADAVFAEFHAEAIDDANDVLEGEARRRAVEGVLEPVYQGGKRVGLVRKFSDQLLIVLLKGNKPEKYRERLEHTGKDGKPIQAEIRTVVFGGRYKPDQAPEPS